jgi:hypothetical protein
MGKVGRARTVLSEHNEYYKSVDKNTPTRAMIGIRLGEVVHKKSLAKSCFRLGVNCHPEVKT